MNRGLVPLRELLSHPSLARAHEIELGVACSAFQSEGGFNLAGAPRTHWRRWERARKVELSGLGADLWNRFPEALSRCQSMGLKVFRMGVEWARLAHGSDALDPEGLDAYASRIALFSRANITPNVTLVHFTHPAWLGEDFWLDRDAPALFADYARRAVEGISRRLVRLGCAPLQRIITLNEPNMLALASYIAGIFPHARRSLAEGSALGPARMVTALDHMLTGHVLARRALRDLYDSRGWPAPDVSFNPNFIDVHALGKGLFDLLRAPSLGVRAREVPRFMRSATERFVTDFYGDERDTTRALVARWVNVRASAVCHPDGFSRTLSTLYERPDERPIDHLAVDLYDPHTAQMVPGAEGFLLSLVRGERLPDMATLGADVLRIAEPWEWQAEPFTLVRMLRALAWPHPTLPIDIDENGMALHRPVGGGTEPRADGLTRTQFLKGYLRALIEARVVHDLPVRAWCCWTLVDNYELGRWAPRFGLYALEDPTENGALGPWSERDANGEDPAGVIAEVSRALGTHKLEGTRDTLEKALDSAT